MAGAGGAGRVSLRPDRLGRAHVMRADTPDRRRDDRRAADLTRMLSACIGERGHGRPDLTARRRRQRRLSSYWTTYRGVEALDNSYALMDLTVFGRQEPWEDPDPSWPQVVGHTRADGRPVAQWPRLAAGHSDDLAGGP
jgi:hypothetical protein